MAVRTKRARMLYKLLYLLGPDNEKYLREDCGKKAFSFTDAVYHALKLFGYDYWGTSNKVYEKIKAQLIADYQSLFKQVSDDKLEKVK